MKKENLLCVRNHEVVISTWTLAKKLGKTHFNVKRLMKIKNIAAFDVGFIHTDVNESQKKSKKKGGQVEEFFLTERDARRLIGRMKQSEKVLAFTDDMIDEFITQKKFLLYLQVQQKNAEWLKKRAEGKLDRRVETDAIQEFIRYAKEQGSENADKYYMIITKMENNALFHLELMNIEHKNFRDLINGIGLNALQMADRIVARCLREKMKENVYYKDIFQYAKARVESFADSLGKIEIETPQVKEIT